jgi:hypothetical protein
MFSIPLEVDVFFKTEESENLELAGLPFDPDYSETRKVTFCTIVGYYPHKVQDKYFGAIMANGSEFITNLSFDKLEEKILKAW